MPLLRMSLGKALLSDRQALSNDSCGRCQYDPGLMMYVKAFCLEILYIKGIV